MINWKIFLSILLGGALLFGVIAIVIYIRERFFANRTPTSAPQPNNHQHTIPQIQIPEPRWTPKKVIANGALLVGILVVICYAIGYSVSSIGLKMHYWKTVFVVSIVLWLWAIIATGALKMCFSNLKENTGAVSVDFFSGKKSVYGPGLCLKYFWEEIKPENIQSLEHRVIELKYAFDLRVAGQMLFDGSVLFTPRLEWLLHLIHFDGDSFLRSFKDRFLEEADREFRKHDHDQAVANQKTVEYAIMAKFEGGDHAFEVMFGGDVSELNFKTNLDPETQKARSTRVEVQTLAQAATSLKDAAVNNEILETLLAHQGKADMKILRGLEGLANIPTALIAATPALASLANAQKGLVGGGGGGQQNRKQRRQNNPTPAPAGGTGGTP